jgi:hypothetical protein
MNDEDFEKKLHALTGALHRPDPTPAWKTDILARARREADAIPIKRMLPPRWLMVGWAAAWVVILAMNFTAPQGTAPRVASGVAAPAVPQTRPQQDFPTLLAFHQHLNLNLDLPQ